MILSMLDQTITFENNEKGTGELIQTINNFLTNENLFFSHLLIDGEEIYDEHEDYIINNMTNINVVEVKTRTIKEFVGSLLVSLNDYTKRAIPEVEALANEFYQTPSEKCWLSLGQLFEGIEWIYQTIKSIDNTQHNISNWDEFVKISAVFEVELPNLLEAIENKDTILIGDLIQYEILPQFQLVYNETEKIFEEI